MGTLDFPMFWLHIHLEHALLCNLGSLMYSWKRISEAGISLSSIVLKIKKEISFLYACWFRVVRLDYWAKTGLELWQNRAFHKKNMLVAEQSHADMHD